VAEIGSVLGGRYRLIELLAQGGMASVFRARDTQLERDVAVKVLRPEYGRDADFLARFKHEAQAAAGLSHPNVVAVYDFGQDPAGPYLVMELVDGQDLAAILRQNGALSARQAARIASATARALQAAHDRGVVHRDVKPGNIMVSKDGRVRVTDFGIARAVAESQLTLPGTTLGSVHYFSPEQARGEATTPASDVYALGIVLFEMLTGRRPWEGDSAAVVAVARLSGPVPTPSSYHGGIPPAIEAIDRKALAPEPGDRFSSAAAMADALDVFLAESAGRDETTGVVGLAAGAAAGAAAAGVVSGVASPSRSAGIPYSPDAYAGGDPGGSTPSGGAAYPPDDDGDRGGTSVWTWIAGLLGIAILVVIGFLAFQLLAGGGEPGASPAPEQVEVPNLVGLSVSQAETVAGALGLEVLPDSTIQSSDLPDGSDLEEGDIAEQDPEAGAFADEGATIRVTIVVGPGVTAYLQPHSHCQNTGAGPDHWSGGREQTARCSGIGKLLGQ